MRKPARRQLAPWKSWGRPPGAVFLLIPNRFFSYRKGGCSYLQELADHPPAHDDWFGYAELCLFLGDEADYRRARRDLLARFGTTTDPTIAERAGLLPASPAELRQAGALTERAVAAGRAVHEFAYPYCLFAEGLARYRQDRFDEAIQRMNGEAAYVMGPCPRLVLAMAQYQKNQKDQARKTLAAALVSHDWKTPKADSHDAWIAQVLRREAEHLIRPDPPALRDDNKR